MSKKLSEFLGSKKRVWKFGLVLIAVLALIIVPVTDLGNKIKAPNTSADADWETEEAKFVLNPRNSSEIKEIDTSETNSTTLTVPSEINGVPITNIVSTTFQKAKSVQNVTIPASVTSISKEAFNRMLNLVTITVDPENPNYMSLNGMLYSKDGTTLLFVPQNTPSTRLDYRVLSGNLAVIGTNAFYLNSTVRDITFPNTVTTVSDNAFYETKIETIYFPYSLQYMNKAFYNNSNLTAVDVQTGTSGWVSYNGVLYGLNADFQATKLLLYPAGKTSSSYTVRNNVTTIGAFAFQGSVNLKTINFNGSEKSIEQQAFDGSGITEFTSPAALTQIGDMAFSNCFALEKIDMSGSKISKIGMGAFSPCKALTDCIFSDFTAEIPLALFSDDEALTNVVLPKGLVSIGAAAFTGCTSLTQIAFPSKLQSIGTAAFAATQVSSFYLGSRIKLGNITDFTLGVIPLVYDADGVPSLGKITIVGYTTVDGDDSDAKKYALANDCNFQDLGEFISKQGDLDGDGKVTPDELNAVIRAVLNKQIIDSNWLSVTAAGKDFDSTDLTTSKRDIIKQLRAALEEEENEPSEEPVVTEEVTEPVTTEEVTEPVTTEEVTEPITTEEVTTEEVTETTTTTTTTTTVVSESETDTTTSETVTVA